MTLISCTHCSTPMLRNTPCPACGQKASSKPSMRVPMAAALLLGLVACDGGGASTDTVVALYGVAVTDEDGDGYASDVDCDDSDPTIHPDAEETAGDGIDSDCDGVDDPAM